MQEPAEHTSTLALSYLQAEPTLTPTPQETPPELRLPRKARTLEELVQGRVPIVAATRTESADRAQVAPVAASGGAVTFAGGRIAVIAGEGAFGKDVDLRLQPLVGDEEPKRRFESEEREVLADPGQGLLRFRLEATGTRRRSPPDRGSGSSSR